MQAGGAVTVSSANSSTHRCTQTAPGRRSGGTPPGPVSLAWLVGLRRRCVSDENSPGPPLSSYPPASAARWKIDGPSAFPLHLSRRAADAKASLQESPPRQSHAQHNHETNNDHAHARLPARLPPIHPALDARPRRPAPPSSSRSSARNSKPEYTIFHNRRARKEEQRPKDGWQDK